jgi:hypothetical protein
MAVTPSQTRIREQWLREEIRASRKLHVTQLQWGITVLVAAELNLYYIRRDAKLHLVAQRVLEESDILPFPRWLIGTVFLLITAIVFSALARRLARHHIAYRKQLIAMKGGYSHIAESVPAGNSFWLNWGWSLLFCSIPLLDIVTWCFFYAGERLKITLFFW